MTIEVKTAVEGCANYCPRFEIKTTNLYEGNKIFYKDYRCANLDECEAMLRALSYATVHIENIT